MREQMQTDGENIIQFTDGNALLKVENYWTEERMKKAIPAETVMPSFEGFGATISEEEIPEVEVEHADVTVSPFNAGGRLFFTRGGYDYRASAQFCADKRIILAAAHSIYAPKEGEWASNIVFKRAYDSGKCAQSIPIVARTIKSKWSETGLIPYDYAFLTTDILCGVEPLDYEINFNKGNVVSYGYPSNFDKGEKMNKVIMNTGEAMTTEGSLALAMYSPMGTGVSGGAFVKEGTKTIVSVASRANGQKVCGPLLDEQFISLLNYAKRFL